MRLPISWTRIAGPILLLLLLVGLTGCSTLKQGAIGDRPFTFSDDTFAYANELLWEYQVDPATRQTITHRREPRPDYALRCFVMVRSARQFFQHARFDPSQPMTNAATYCRLVRRVFARSPRAPTSEERRIVMPGFANLREFSRAHERLLKTESGGAWPSYFQRGHWRMVFPFSRHHQERTAKQLSKAIAQNRAAAVHVVRFPKLTINHALLLYGRVETASEIKFLAYDPNDPKQPTILKYDRLTRNFDLPPNPYFAGGRVDVYEIYHAVHY